MKVSGFTFLRNAVINGYPFEESIKSILPIVDEFICVVGNGHDATLDRVKEITDPKMRIIEAQWNESMQDRGFVYGQQKMIGQYNCSGDWAFYLEGDEVLHENEIESILRAMRDNLSNHNVEALYFNFLHFYGNSSQTGIAGYRSAPRIIRNSLRSYAPDGLFWVVMDKNKRGRYPKAASANASIYHYGHCRSTIYMAEKVKQVGKYWGRAHESFTGYGSIDSAELRPFEGTHPMIMKKWLDQNTERSFQLNPSYQPTFRDYRNRLRFWIEKQFDLEISKKHYKRID